MRMFDVIFKIMFKKRENARAYEADRVEASVKKYRVARCDEPTSKPIFSPVFSSRAETEADRKDMWELLLRVAAFGAKRTAGAGIKESVSAYQEREKICREEEERDDEFFAPLAALQGLNVAERIRASER